MTGSRPRVAPHGVIDYVRRIADAGDGLPVMLYLRNETIGLEAIGLSRQTTWRN